MCNTDRGGNLNNALDPADFFGGQRSADAARARNEAKAAEAERSARITRNVNDINSAFGGREVQYADLGSALRERFGEALAKQRGDAQRQMRFSIARSGLTGGSAQRDAATRLNDEAREGALKVEQAAQRGVADLRGQDEQARLQLIGLAQSGNDIGNAAAQSASMLRANLGNARAVDATQGLGDVFGATAQVNRNMQDAAARRRGLNEARTYVNPFSRG